MPFTEDYRFPDQDELTTQEINVSSPTLRAVAPYMGKSCDFESKEFMLCRTENLDPRKCLAEGRAVTECGLKFLQNMKKMCAVQVEQQAECLEWANARMEGRFCRKTEGTLDKCVLDNLGIEAPHLGYFSMPRIHESQRPKPVDVIASREYQTPPSINDAPDDVKNTVSKHGTRAFFAP